MAELKTKQTEASVEKFLSTVADEGRRKDCRTLVGLMKKVTKSKPTMWGKNIVGFGSFHYVYASGREGDWMMLGFSPRKQNLTVYTMMGLGTHAPLLKKLGPHSRGGSCLYIKRLEDIDLDVLEALLTRAVAALKKKYR